MTPDELLGATVARPGHTVLESGHHGELWLDLELLCLRPRELERAVALLAEELRSFDVEAVCGPLNEGAFVALMVASRLDVEFTYAGRFEEKGGDRLFPVQYRLPRALRSWVAGKRVVIVNDVINAGSAVRGAHATLLDCGAVPIAIAALVVLGDAATHFAAENNLRLISLAQWPNRIWIPAECPLCAVGVPLDEV
ncbi:MAG TPA: phosphoribosyltransferase family protein [Chloroflexota bacterium]|nr:phosphoribosyltransferase family protein [Chloroflexota bacterium]